MTKGLVKDYINNLKYDDKCDLASYSNNSNILKELSKSNDDYINISIFSNASLTLTLFKQLIKNKRNIELFICYCNSIQYKEENFFINYKILDFIKNSNNKKLNEIHYKILEFRKNYWNNNESYKRDILKYFNFN